MPDRITLTRPHARLASPLTLSARIAPPMPLTARILGVQGPPGPAGTGLGTIDYTDLDAADLGPDGSVTSGVAVPLPAGEWVRVVRRLAPSDSNRNLPRGPFADFVFWDGTRLRARARGDVLLFKLAYRVTSALRGATIRFAVRPGDDPAFDFGPQPITLGADAGAVETGSETFVTQCRARFVDLGAGIFVLSSSGGQLLSLSPEITPLDAAP
ncbi:MAG: hypothetical protein WAP03_22150 [Methylorubrum rhodinum]|uniref:hypothetical protein n=1 Tax=Methylorubrum rhodinum TaxID=29428 RepID=UPI003BAF5ED4